MGPEKRQSNPFDSITLFIWLALMIIGWMAILATTYDDEFRMFNLGTNHGKQLLWMGLSSLTLFTIMGFDRRFLQNLAYPIYGATMLLVMSVFVIGSATKGNLNWVDLGFFKLQPSEFAKFATALALSRYLDTPQVRFNTWKQRFTAFSIVALPLGLVLAQGDAGSALVFVGFVFVFNKEGLSSWIIYFGLYMAAISVLALAIDKFLLITIIVIFFSLILAYIFLMLPRERALVALIVGLMLMSLGYVVAVDTVFNKVLKPHQQDRINVILGKIEDNAGVAYNLNQSKIAIGSGGLLGKGFLQGTQTRFDFVPEMSTDFIFCSIGEEWGFVGAIVLIALFVALIQRLIILSERQRSAFSRVYIFSVAAIIFMHFTINIGMTIGLLPVIGIPLPFISYGGSSLLSFTMMIAVAIKLDSERIMSIR